MADDAIATSVILMVPDGFGAAADAAYRYFNGADPAWLDGLRAVVRTASASSPTTDLAAAATAFATGVKTDNGAVAVDGDGNPLVSILDLASDAGKATGIVSTAAITDATPAAFAASAPDRDDRAGIAQQYVDNNVLDVILGGGHEDFAVDANDDGTTTLEEAQAAGFVTAATRDDLLAAPDGRLLGLFAESALGAPIGNGAIGSRTDGQPSLAEMTDAALARLSADTDGFFLLVEEEGTDTWGHANDTATVMNAARSFEDAFRVARAYADANPGTLVISVADHETGGLTLPLAEGRTPDVFRSFAATQAEMFAAVDDAVADLGPADPDVVATVNEIVSEATGGAVTLTADEVASVLGAATAHDSLAAFSSALNARGGVGYSTTGHTAADVPLYAFGAGADLHAGVIDNTSVAGWLAEAMGLTFPEQGESGTVFAISGRSDGPIASGSGRNLIGGPGDDRLRGGDGSDRLKGRGGDDVMSGAGGDDGLRGGTGDDLLDGGPGSDVFVFSRNSGSDRLMDLAVGEDRLRFEGPLGGVDAMLAASTQEGSDVVVVLGEGNEVRLEGIDLAALQNADLVLA